MITSFLILTAVVLSVDSGVATIDKGRLDGVRPGDTGQVYYTLAVGPERRPARIDVGRLEVLAVEDSVATLKVPASPPVRAGFSIDLRIPEDRLAAPTEPAPSDSPAASPARSQLPGGTYRVGTDLDQARFYNQHPRHEVVLEPFEIDRAPVTQAAFRELRPELPFPTAAAGGFATGVSYEDAERYCRARGLRLATEQEWEAAHHAGQLAERFSLYEWTSSWYEAYPGNAFPEEAYGRGYRVLRGSPRPGEQDASRRSYLKPQSRRPDVGFRCAGGTSDER